MSKDKSTTASKVPEAVAYRSGCKVCWRYYKTKEDAQKVVANAKATASRRAAEGYDFGYCSPGSISYIDPAQYPDSQYAGLYEVCFP